MRAAQVTAMGGPDVLTVVDLPDPAPGPNQVLVRVQAAGVGPWDTKMRAGAFGPVPTPYVPGAELAGQVGAVGVGVDGFAIGDQVWAYPALQGATAELAVIDAATVGHAPRTLSPAEAASAPVGLLTAEQALDRVGLEAGQVVLVLAAAGNVGAFAVQRAVARGARVVAQAGRTHFDRLRALGAAVVVDRDQDWPTHVRTAFPSGVDVVVDPLGGTALAAATGLVKDHGRVVSLIPAEHAPGPRGIVVTTLLVRPDGDTLTRLASVFDDGGLQVQLGPTLPLADVAQAHRVYERGTRGKVVVTLD